MADNYDKYKVYWQRPSGEKTVYPCLIYSQDRIGTEYADNTSYKNLRLFTLTLIGKEADNDPVIERFLELPYCSYDRRYIADNLYHDVLEIYF